MDFNRGEISVKSTNISEIDRKGGKFIMMSGQKWAY